MAEAKEGTKSGNIKGMDAHMIGYSQYGSTPFMDRLNEYCHHNETPASYLGLINTADDEFKRYRERVYNLKKKNKGLAYMCN